MMRFTPLAALLAVASACHSAPAMRSDPDQSIGRAQPAARPASSRPSAFAGGRLSTDGAPRQIVLADGRTLSLTPVRIVGLKPGIVAECGVTIDAQPLVTIGAGDTDAYECTGLVEAGPLPASGGHARIGLIYDVGSPNAAFRTAIVLQSEGGVWRIDPASVGAYDDTPAARSVKALAAALAKGG